MSLKDTFQNYHNGLKENILTPLSRKLDLVHSVVADQIVCMEDVENNVQVRRTADGQNILDNTWSTVNRINGKTSASPNLIPTPTAWSGTSTTGGVQFKIESDGSISLSGTSTVNFQKTFYYDFKNDQAISLIKLKAGKTYYLSGCPSGGSSTTFDLVLKNSNGDDIARDYGKGAKIELKEDVDCYAAITVAGGITLPSSCRFYPTLTEVSAQSFTTPFIGLRSAQMTGIKSIGRNIANIDNLVGGALTKNNDGTYTITKTSSGRFSLKGTISMPSGNFISSAEIDSIYDPSANGGEGGYVEKADYGISIRVFANDKPVNTAGIPAIKGESTDTAKGASTDINYYDIYISGQAPDGYAITFKNFMISYGKNKIPYEPYTESIMELPDNVTLGKWDYIENGKLYKQTSEVVTLDGTESWSKNEKYGASGTSRFDLSLNAMPAPVNVSTNYSNILIATGITPSTTVNGVGIFVSDINGTLGVRIVLNGDKVVADLTDWLQSLVQQKTPLTFAYKLATPTVTDLVFDNKYQVVNQGIEQVESNTPGINMTIYNNYYTKIGDN